MSRRKEKPKQPPKPNNGKSFEKMVGLVQEAYRESPNTKIYVHHKIEDRHGNLREFDVFIVIISNGYQFRVAVECKDYSSAVPVEKIEAFNSKCSTVSNINKKVFIAANGFQAGAIRNAELFDIELQTLSTIRKVEIPTFGDDHTGYIGVLIEILNYNLTVDSGLLGETTFSKASIDDTLTLSYENNKILSINDFLYGEINKLGAQEAMLEGVQKEATKRATLLFKQEIIVEDNFRITPMDNHPIILHTPSKRLLVRRIDIKAKVTCRSKNRNSDEVEVRSHNDIQKNKKGELYSVQFDNKSEPHIYYEQIDEAGNYIGTTQVKLGESAKLSSKFSINTKTGQFSNSGKKD